MDAKGPTCDLDATLNTAKWLKIVSHRYYGFHLWEVSSNGIPIQ